MQKQKEKKKKKKRKKKKKKKNVNGKSMNNLIGNRMYMNKEKNT